LLNIDRVIKVIRNADEPKPELIRAFKLSERQAEDILDLRLRQLARLEASRSSRNWRRLRKEQAALQKLLGAGQARCAKLVGKEFDDDAKNTAPLTRTRAAR